MASPGFRAVLVILSNGFLLQILTNIVTGVKDDVKIVTQTVGVKPSSTIAVKMDAPPYCPQTNGVGQLTWTKPMGDIEFVYLNSFKQLWCCASGYKSITWRRRSEGSVWQSIKYGAGIMLEENQQQLIIQKFTKEDEGDYECIADDLNGRQPIRHEYRVVMDDSPVCNTAASPIFGKPQQNNTFYNGQIGEDKTIACLVSFGMSCGPFTDSVAAIKWYEAVNGSCSKSVDYQTAAKTRDTGADDRLLMRQDLLLANITESDFGRQWCCRASRNNKDYTTLLVGLQAPPNPSEIIKKEPANLKVILSVILSAVGVTFIIVVLLWVYRLEILLLHHAKYGKRPQQENFEYLYDLILIHSPDDYRFVHDVLTANLEERWHYRVFLPKRDLEMGYEDAAWMDGLRQSRKLVWILSANFLVEQKCGTIHNYIIDEKRNEDIIYIRYHDIPKRLWEANEFIPNIDILHKSVKNAGRSWLRLGKMLHWCEDYDHKDDGRIILNDNKSKAVIKFWKQLRLYLPPKNEGAPPENSEHRPHRLESMREQSTVDNGIQGPIAVVC